MSLQSQADIIESQADVIASQEGIIETMRAILVQEGDDREVLREARTALSDWFVATYPHLYPPPPRPQLRVVRGRTGGTMRRPAPRRYPADRFCAECALLVPVEVVVRDPLTIGCRCAQGHMWLAGTTRMRG